MRAQLLWTWHRQVIPSWRGSRVHRAWQWWLGQLRGCLPERWSRQAPEQLYRWPLPVALPAAAASRPVLLLEPGQALQQSLVLPAAAARDLNSVLAYELDRFTPLRAEQAYYAARRDGISHGRLRLTLVCARREHVHAWVAAYRLRDIQLTTIDALDAQGQRIGINLLPSATPKPHLGQRRAFSLSLAVLCLLLTFTAMLLALHNREAAVATRAAEVQQLRQQTAELQGLRGELARTGGAARALMDLKLAQPTRALLLAEFSACLPADSWLQSLQVTADGQVDLAGLSGNASGLILHMKSCPHLVDLQYQGIIQPDASSGKDRFYLRAHLTRGGEHVAEPLTP
jgi:general secretion pathway protein L